ncbi:MAG: RNA polymerase sigma factor [Planctomycetota bacterium]
MMNTEDADAVLMQRIKSGDIGSFDELLGRHHKRVLNIVYKFIGNEQSSEGLAQEVFLRVFRAKESYKPTAKFTTWLYQIVKNLCLQQIKKKSNQTYSIDANPDNPGEYIQSPGALPSEIVEKKETADRVKEAIAGLPPNQRIAIILNKYEELSYQEIADTMDISAKAVKSLLLRARVNIKEKLADYVTPYE